jgi:hypothetical protein
MKICNRCHVQDSKHREVGQVHVEVAGYHYKHHSHLNKTQHWAVDLCPTCADELKGRLAEVLKDFEFKGKA